MNDPWNPSAEEVRDWAYNAEALEPCEDFDLALEWSRHERVLLECAADIHCPKKEYFLGVLYLIVGDAVRTEYRSLPRPILEGFIGRGNEYPHPTIQKWQHRTRELMKNPDSFSYDLWCAGGLARASS